MIDIVWERLKQSQGREFVQIRGQVFTYEIIGNFLMPSTTNIKIHKNQFENALDFCPLRNTVPLRNLVAPSYLFALLTDNRIVGGIDFSTGTTFNKLVVLFEKSLKLFMNNSVENILNDVSERNLCVELRDALLNYKAKKRWLDGYFIDNEYNRNLANPSLIKTIYNENLQIVNITCDIILHSRGKIVEQDNLLAIEMKKSSAPKELKDQDRARLCALTKDSFDDVWSFDGKTLPEHVCRYVLGVYLEIDKDNRQCLVEYYKKGKFLKSYSLNF